MEQRKLGIEDLKVLLGICERGLICTKEIFIEKKTNILGDERIFVTAPEKLGKPIMVTGMVPIEGEEYERCLKNGSKLYDEYVAKDHNARMDDMVHPVVKTFELLSGIAID